MAITSAQKSAIEDIINVLLAATPSRGKRQLAGMFLELVDRSDWPQYYEIIPEPRCINGVRANVEKNRYKDPLNAYTDLSLVFWNALFYNEPGSQIATDAETLKNILVTEWQKRSVLPSPRLSPPPASPQKVHKAFASTQPHPAQPAAAVAKSTQSDPSANSKLAPSHLASSPEMDVDVNDMSPEPEGQSEEAGMGSVAGDGDGDSETIIRQLEQSLPRWDGFGDSGWMSEINKDRLLDLVVAIKSHKDIVGNRLAVALEAVPEEPAYPLLSYQSHLSLKIVEGRVRSGNYESAKAFDLDMARLFEKARRWHEPCTEPYGHVLLLQRLYQALTSSSPPSGPPYASTTNFASVRAGPGTARPLHSADAEGVPGVTTFRVSNKDRTFVEEVHYKGWSIRLADWLHLSNPDDPSRPIVGQVFKCWLSEDPAKKGQPGVTVCWYYRPEQTFHPAHTLFMEKEVFKTSHFADHPVEDVIEKIACQFTARHIRGRPRPPFWYPGWPLYVCHSRYNDRERLFVKIKNWSSCIPEEVRKKEEFMPIYASERLVYPPKVGSPFVGKNAVKGPGGIGDPVEKAEGEKIEGGGTGRKRTKRNNTATVEGSSSSTAAIAATSSSVALTKPAAVPPYYSQTQQQVAQTQKTQGTAATGADAKDRTMLTAAGNLSVPPVVDKLPPETTKYFDRSPETNEVLWFGAPPLNVVRPPAVKHSLTYLHFLARKRKEMDKSESNPGAADAADEAMDVDDSGAEGSHGGPDRTTAKRLRGTVPPTVTEMMKAALDAVTGQSER
ncbi:hypothetical protein EDD16DRAFT_1483863 [Pisolithus croceorrhizus]|nr:hypothetical protein EDD16DRAFT_1483863 [Pisolithus croceorrhizus]KAI6133794.1 hypothetical protein EV401DRAFT_2180951 [Pisolithus croceorrhizus]KAI6165447.1 hypothetical protein EDD17DRAFT_1796879 [Pisolithus thermaeus]